MICSCVEQIRTWRRRRCDGRASAKCRVYGRRGFKLYGRLEHNLRHPARWSVVTASDAERAVLRVHDAHGSVEVAHQLDRGLVNRTRTIVVSGVERGANQYPAIRDALNSGLATSELTSYRMEVSLLALDLCLHPWCGRTSRLGHVSTVVLLGPSHNVRSETPSQPPRPPASSQVTPSQNTVSEPLSRYSATCQY